MSKSAAEVVANGFAGYELDLIDGLVITLQEIDQKEGTNDE